MGVKQVHLAPSCQDFSKSKIFYNWQKMASRKSKSEVEREKIIQSRCQELLKRMLQDEDNKYCVDCDAKGPRWVSWNLGIFVCIRCAGIHRNLGVHISKVKSVNLDSWTPHQVACMQIMGNSRARAVYEANVPEGFRRPQTDSQLDVFIRAKYEKKKYIAREWVPTKAPELPEGWTALIEAEKQKKDIRSIVLPSHTKDSKEEIVKRERQSPKEVAKKSDVKSPKIMETKTSKPSLDSEFDLLSLNEPNKTNSGPVVPVEPKSSVTDLLGLGDSTSGGGQEFNDFVGPSTTNQNGTGNGSTTTATSSNNQNSFFADFAEMSTSTSVNSTNSNSSNENQPQKQQTMSKDSIMALFNQRPAAAPASNPMFATTSQPQGFVQHGQGGGGVVGGGGMQIPASFGLGVGLQQQQQQQQPLQAQHFAQPNAASTAFATLNNPFLGMVQTDPTTNNIFGSGFTTTPTGHNFLQ